ncbi:MAG: FumA C-terminus/TtdB family hydratase beta subunit [Verrucomicrobiota bacterium]
MNNLKYPFKENAVRSLSVSDRISLSGRIITGRDRVHEKLAGEDKSPVDMRDGAIYHCGPVAVLRSGRWVISAAGPTTSSRQEPFMAEIIRRHGVRVIIGKGGMHKATMEACRRHGCVYVHVVGGAGAALAERIVDVCGVHYMESFGPAEAMWELDVDGMEGIVTIDSGGCSLHDDIAEKSERILETILRG